jgi:hypothetical protein
MKPIHTVWLAAALNALLYGSVKAGEVQGEPPASGAAARTWLDLQVSGEASAPPPRLPGEAAQRSYQRYLQSFEQPIPESYFPDDGFVEE